MRWIFGALRNLFRGHAQPARKSPRLTVEHLEDRLTPAGDFRSVIGLDAVQDLYPYQGKGYTVALLDTGIDYNDADLGGGFGAGKRVIAGWDFVNNDADPMDDNGHGTHLAGIIGSSNAALKGIAPEVNFVALKVLDASNNGTWANIESALQWVVVNQAAYNIVGVNLSLGSSNYSATPYSMLEDEFSTLKSKGVFTAVAAGNRFFTHNSTPGLSYPAISPQVVSVGATWAGDFGAATFSTGAKDFTSAVDRVASFTQRASNLSLMAPGTWITSDWLNGMTRVMGGTSQATAVVTGSAVLLHEAYDKTGKSAQANQDNILALMKSTGVNVIDGDDENDNVVNTGLTFKRVNLQAAMSTVGQPTPPTNSPPTLAPIADQALQVGQKIFVDLAASDPQNQPITFTYKQIYLPAQAYLLDQQYGFTSTASFAANSQGYNEKWIAGSNQTQYAVLPNGEVRRWAGSMAATLAQANLISTFDATYYANTAKISNAPYAGMPPVVFGLAGSKLSIRSPAYWIGTYQVEVTASDGQNAVKRVFNVNQTAATTTTTNAAPVLAAIANQTITRKQSPLVITLSATDANNDTLTYSAQVQPINGQTPPVTTSMVGNKLTITPIASYVGTFTIKATVSDGKVSDTKSFTVTVTNAAPTLGTIAAQTIAAGQPSVNVALPAGDADNDTLTFQAVAQTPNALAYQLDQTYAFQPANATYYYNLQGKNEKWLIGKNNVWYALMPTGQVYRWSRSMDETLTAANLVGSFNSTFYAEPRLLWDAKPATTPALTFSYQGNVLTIQRPAGLTGVYFIDVTTSDGLASATRTFQLMLN